MSRGLRFFSPWPSSKPLILLSEDLKFMWRQGAFFLHYISGNDKPFSPGYELIVDDKNYGFGSISSSKRRHHIRWALKRCVVKKVSFDSVVDDAGLLIWDTHRRQNRVFNSAVMAMWKNYFRLAESNPLFEAWVALVRGQLAAMCIVIMSGDGAYIEMTFSRTHFLKFHPVDSLVFVVTQQLILKDGVNFVSYGKRPIIGEAESLVSFKESMGFKKIPVKERIEISPFLKPILCGPLGTTVGNIADRYSDHSMYARIIAGVTNTLCSQNKYTARV